LQFVDVTFLLIASCEELMVLEVFLECLYHLLSYFSATSARFQLPFTLF